MKKTLILFTFIAVVIGCNSNTSTDTSAGSAPSAQSDPDADKGLELVAKSDCFSCHKVDEQLTGPAYTAIAAKYPSNDESIEFLSKKIRKGGAGNWGTIPMLPHPEISEDDARLMAKYVLSLKK